MFEFSWVTAVQVRLCFLPFLQSWDAALAKTAKAWAKKCKFEHNIYLKVARKVHPTFTPVGENIWTGTATIFSVDAALNDWFNEVSSYDFNTNSCTDMCGHYTQVSLTCPMVYNVMVSEKIQGLWNRLLWNRNYSRGFHPPVYCCTRLERNIPSPRDVRGLFLVMEERDFPLTISCFQGSQIINAKPSINQSFVSAALGMLLLCQLF